MTGGVTAGGAPTGGASAIAMAEEGRGIGGYAILETIEIRAFSVTYRAERRDLGRTARLKTLKPTVSSRSPAAALLAREAKVLARLEHEGVLRLYDFASEAGAVFLVTEDVRGASLAELVRAGKVEPPAAAAIALAVALAVGHAHERGVTVRALRPEAIVVTPLGALKLVDFAEAVLADDEATSAPVVPLDAGESLERPDYMAPEQILGEPSDARADVWSLGVILHELLAGERPFAAEGRRAVAQRIRGGAPSPLPEGVPRALERVVSRCFAKAPDDRFEDARAVAGALDEALEAMRRGKPAALIVRALARAKLGDEPSRPEGASAQLEEAPARGPDVIRAAWSLGVVLGLIAVGGALIQLLGEAAPTAPASAITEGTAAPLPQGASGRGSLRVVARPWAEVYLDGELLDVTPIARPLLVTPGRHFVTFRHPYAPDEQRSIKIAAGQTVLLDVNMRVERPGGDAGARTPPVDPAASP